MKMKFKGFIVLPWRYHGSKSRNSRTQICQMFPDVQYVGSKRPAILSKQTFQHVSRLKVYFATAAVSLSVASKTDIEFLKCYTAEPKKNPEYSGYNTRNAR